MYLVSSMGLFDFIFPKRCVSCKKLDSYLCENCFTFLSFDVKSLCLACNKPSFNGLTHSKCKKKYSIDGCFSAISSNKIAHKLIYTFKQKPYLSDLKHVLTDLFYESVIQNEEFIKQIVSGEWMMVPVPLSKTKLRKRGYNQSKILANELAKKFNIPVADVLERNRDTKTQAGLSRIEKRLNVKNVFEITNHKFLINKNIFLIDDVVTTGATLSQAAKLLKENAAKKVIGLTLVRD